MKTEQGSKSLLESKDFQSALKKLFQHFNQLSEKTINPLLTGIFMLGVASTFFEPGMVAYLTMVYGASNGIAYAIAKSQSAKNLPAWFFPAVGVSSALVYGMAGIPGIILAAGLSGGWYLHTHFQDKIQQFKVDFEAFSERLKANPVSEGVNFSFRAVQFVSNFILHMEEPPIAAQNNEPQNLEEPQLEEVLEEQPNASNDNEQQAVVTQENNDEQKQISDLQKKLEEPAMQIHEPAVMAPEQSELQKPSPVLFSQAATTQSTASVVKQPVVPKITKPKTDDVKVFGKTVLELERRTVAIDNSWTGLAKAFIYSMDPRVDLVNEAAKNNRPGMK